MNESLRSDRPERPSALSAFISGGTSGLFSGLVMTLIIATIAPALPLVGLGVAGATFGEVLLTSGPLMMAASTLFGGIMSTKRALFDAPHGGHSTIGAPDIVPVPVSIGAAPVMAASMALADTAADQAPPKNWAIDAAPDQVSGKSWVAQTERGNDTDTRIQQILADGSLTDQDRASAILASRESADHQVGRA